MKRARLALGLTTLAAAAGIAGCAWLARRQAATRCEFRIAGVETVDYSILDPLEIGLVLTIGARNPNDVEAILEPFQWRLLVGETEVARGRRDRSVALAPGVDSTFTMPVRVELWEGARSVAAAIVEGEATWSVPAVVYLSTPLGPLEYELVMREGRWSAGDLLAGR